MLEIISLLIITGVCAPFDWSDCDWTIEIRNMTSAYGMWNGNKTIYFVPGYETLKDCWGNSVWTHEWWHGEYGHWHVGASGVCELKPWFSFPEK